MAYIVLAHVLASEATFGHYKDPKEAFTTAKKYAEKAVALDDSLSYAHAALGWTLVMNRDYDYAIAEGQRAVDLEPGSAQVNHYLGAILSYSGHYEEGVSALKNALRLSPVPFIPSLTTLSMTYRMLGQYQESIAVVKVAIKREPDSLAAHLNLAATYELAGKEPEARAEAAEVLIINPNFSLEQFANSYPMKNRTDLMDRWVEPLRKAGLK
jgi:tetratricopeptide (TPR) repeat protein